MKCKLQSVASIHLLLERLFVFRVAYYTRETLPYHIMAAASGDWSSIKKLSLGSDGDDDTVHLSFREAGRSSSF
jgi:hypothetical protein